MARYARTNSYRRLRGWPNSSGFGASFRLVEWRNSQRRKSQNGEQSVTYVVAWHSIQLSNSLLCIRYSSSPSLIFVFFIFIDMIILNAFSIHVVSGDLSRSFSLPHSCYTITTIIYSATKYSSPTPKCTLSSLIIKFQPYRCYVFQIPLFSCHSWSRNYPGNDTLTNGIHLV